jgi:IMP dehydrogenase/GMP reductase
MLGGMLAGTEECDGEWEYEYEYALKYKGDRQDELFWSDISPNSIGAILVGTYTGNKRKSKFVFYGMSSYEAQDKYKGRKSHAAAEGKRVVRPYLGPANSVLQEIEGGLRSCCAYIGATSIRYMRDCGTFVRVNNTHNRVFE